MNHLHFNYFLWENSLWYTSVLDYKHVSRTDYARNPRFYCIAVSLLPLCASDGMFALTVSLTLLGLNHRSVIMFVVEETKNHASDWKFCHILVKLQSSNNCASWSLLTDDWAVGLVVYWCVLMLSEQESHMLACICRSGSDFCIICFAVLGTVWLSPGVYEFSKSGRHLNILCVSRVPWNMSHTEDSTNIKCRCAKWSYLGNVVPKMLAPLS